MSPVHHHFEMSGWGEGKIVVVFSLVQAAACVAAVISAITSI
jgi:phospho-N-acetylmuramoyl-pentapeptide-transferase